MTRPQYLDDLKRDGYAVVPNVIPSEACEEFIDSALSWLESFPYGFKRDDRNTWTAEHLPDGSSRGLYNRYSCNHEDFVWKIRVQPGILKVFAEIWGTDDLIASFDGMNVSLPINEKTGRTDISPTKPWPHIDQNLDILEQFEMYQGIANCAPSGINDGGLVVLAGSHRLHKNCFAGMEGFRVNKPFGEGRRDDYFDAEDVAWYKQHGCREVKVCAGAGDLILWDSRTIHWNSSPVESQGRFATYVCYCPRCQLSEEVLREKREVFEARKGTTHKANINHVPEDEPDSSDARPKRPDGSLDPADRTRPFKEPVVTDAVLRLVGVRSR